ncbi:glycosidase [Photobacterium sp. GJ3]|uniref:alpha-amylase family glycosyl hydrolase n=1 Tax=Photobacterium sp. GJ3 TaxID=2829502 RepID=UPI001B8D9D6C|nr:alpha-amylase family glycosyl hydrolase [Photobacterium sp. GJ3]QUJ68554.1 glycosidase [Photobacterium sp. GJ3]
MKSGRILSILLSGILAGCGSSESSDNPGDALRIPYGCQTSMATEANQLRIYQVMVESFVDGDPAVGHGTGYGTSHHQGDLKGVIDSLDYIQSLGMNAIWLTPVFESKPIIGQDHWADKLDATGYFATDYFSIDPRFGTLDDARNLVEQAHQRGMYVFFDGVFGHHKGEVVPSPSGLKPAGDSNPVGYPESLPFYQEVAAYWIRELKIDGWRLDQAYQVPLDAWQAIRKTVDEASRSVTYTNHQGVQVHPLGYMVAEIWNNENYINQAGYGPEGSPGLCSAFDFPLRYRLVEIFAVNENGNGGKGGDWLAEGMDLHRLYPSHAQPSLMLGNHDLVRFGDLLQRGNIAEPEDDEYWQRHRAALSFLAAYSGPVTLYYGEEIGDEVSGFAQKVSGDTCALIGLCDDHVARSSAKIEGMTHSLDLRQQQLKEDVARLMRLRASHPALYAGERLNVLANPQVYIDRKQQAEDTIIFMVSTTADRQNWTLNTRELGAQGPLTDLLTGQQFQPIQGRYDIPLNGFEARFLQVETPVTPVISRTQASTLLSGSGRMADCQLPDIDETGPVRDPLYVVGDFTDAGWQHRHHRQLTYKGQNLYQVVVSEQAGSYRMQYAAKDWSPQYTAQGLVLRPGLAEPLITGNYGKDTAATLPEDGRYVWSLSFTDTGLPEQVMVSKCQ